MLYCLLWLATYWKALILIFIILSRWETHPSLPNRKYSGKSRPNPEKWLRSSDGKVLKNHSRTLLSSSLSCRLWHKAGISSSNFCVRLASEKSTKTTFSVYWTICSHRVPSKDIPINRGRRCFFQWTGGCRLPISSLNNSLTCTWILGWEQSIDSIFFTNTTCQLRSRCRGPSSSTIHQSSLSLVSLWECCWRMRCWSMRVISAHTSYRPIACRKWRNILKLWLVLAIRGKDSACLAMLREFKTWKRSILVVWSNYWGLIMLMLHLRCWDASKRRDILWMRRRKSIGWRRRCTASSFINLESSVFPLSHCSNRPSIRYCITSSPISILPKPLCFATASPSSKTANGSGQKESQTTSSLQWLTFLRWFGWWSMDMSNWWILGSYWIRLG